jgi:RNA-directed DNA polymerase
MSSYNAKNPTGGATIRRVNGAPDPNLHLLERTLATDNVKTAWERVKANKGTPGVDNVSIDQFPDRRLKLTVNEKKSRVGPTDSTEYLGFVFKKFKVCWSDKAFSEFKRRVRKLTGRSWGVSLNYRLKKLALYVRGWMNYLGISEYYDPVSEIDSWLKRRIRACLWKQWKRPRTRIRELRRMGTSLKSAIFAGISRKGPWRCSRTKATQIGISNQWLANMGLICIKDLWVKIHYSAAQACPLRGASQRPI